MIAMIAQRIGAAFFTLVLISLLVFGALELMAGDACTAYLGRDAQPSAVENCRARLRLDRPAYVRYTEWASHAVRGDLGRSMQRERRIADIISWRLRNTLILSAVAATVGIPLAILLGVVAGLQRERAVDHLVSTTALLAMTIPEFVLATALVLLFAVTLGWTSGVVTTVYNAPWWEMLTATPLAALTLTLILTAHILRMVRSSMIDVMQSDFVLMARLKGVPERRIIFAHALPNALFPAISVIGLTVAWLFSGVVVVENVFNYPGLGRLAVNAVGDRDMPLVQAIALLFGLFYIGATLMADLAAMALNPRLRTYRT